MNYIYGWEDISEMLKGFGAPEDALKDCQLLFGIYIYADYSGRALAAYKKNNQLYMTTGSHCSCDGLEHCWEPETTTKEIVCLELVTLKGYCEEEADRVAIVNCLMLIEKE